MIELCRPSDSRLEHVDFECLFSSLSLRLLLRVFASLLLERRVIFTADKLRLAPAIILLQITVVRLLSRPEDHTPRIEHRCWGEWSRCGILLNLFKQSARDEMIGGKGYDAEKSKEFKGYIRETNNMRKRTS